MAWQYVLPSRLWSDHTVPGFREKQVLHNKTSEAANNSDVIDASPGIVIKKVSIPMQVKGSSSSKGTFSSTYSSICTAPGEPNWSHCSQMEPARSLFPVQGLLLHWQVLPHPLLNSMFHVRSFKLPAERQKFHRNHLS